MLHGPNNFHDTEQCKSMQEKAKEIKVEWATRARTPKKKKPKAHNADSEDEEEDEGGYIASVTQQSYETLHAYQASEPASFRILKPKVLDSGATSVMTPDTEWFEHGIKS